MPIEKTGEWGIAPLIEREKGDVRTLPRYFRCSAAGTVPASTAASYVRSAYTCPIAGPGWSSPALTRNCSAADIVPASTAASVVRAPLHAPRVISLAAEIGVVAEQFVLSRNLGVSWVFRLGVRRVWGVMGRRVIG